MRELTHKETMLIGGAGPQIDTMNSTITGGGAGYATGRGGAEATGAGALQGARFGLVGAGVGAAIGLGVGLYDMYHDDN